MRCFIGCPIPAPAGEALTEAFAPLRARFQGPGCNWVPAANLHYTLRFLGEMDRGRLGRVTAAARPVVLAVEAPRLELDEPGFFSRGPRGLVLWAGLKGEVEELGRVAQELEACARAAGFAPEGRGFKPHITLARIQARRVEALPACLLPALPPMDCTPPSVNLYQSIFERGGVRYEVLETWPFRRPRGAGESESFPEGRPPSRLPS